MIKTDIFTRLRRMFSTRVVVRRLAKNRLRVIDTSHAQSTPKSYSRYRGAYVNRNPFQFAGYSKHDTTRIQLFEDYEMMDSDPIISSAMDIYADEATVKNHEGDILSIVSDNAEITKILYNLFYEILNIEFNMWPWIRNLVKYGDFYLYLDLKEDVGILNVLPLSAYEVRREEGIDENNPYEVIFIWKIVRIL